jgi:tryptophan-rich sensory protein
VLRKDSKITDMEIVGAADLSAIVVAALSALALIALGALATELGPWYYGLKQPPWKPSDLWFGPVWATIFTLTAWAGLRAWGGAVEGSPRLWLIAGLVLNGVLNVLWSVLFFRWKRPDWALIEVVPLWLSIVLLLGLFALHDSLAPWLVLPYLVWVSFAACLNLAVVRLNSPF